MGKYGYPRTSQWKAAMLMNYYAPSGGGSGDEILFGDTVTLWGSTTVTFND